MRSRKAIINTIAAIIYELSTIICGFIIPRLILGAFGSDYNGITNAITQFLGYSNLLKSGIEGVTRAALYKPLAEKNDREISGIVNATELFLRKVSVIFASSMLIFASVFSLFVQENFDWLFTFSLILIIGFGKFAQYFFGLTYRILLGADQKQVVYSIIQTVALILSTIIAAILIKLGASIHAVKLGSTITFLLNPLLISLYAHHYYKIDKTVPPNNKSISQRWDSFGLQVANFINSNTDMLVLTAFTNIFEVSVYSVYHMATSGIRRLLFTLVPGFGAAFGNMFAKNEGKLIEKNLLIYEQIVFSIANIFFSICFVMIVPFVQVYTKSITDVNYIRYSFGYLSTIAILFTCYRVPYQAIVEAVGHYRQTRNGAFFEAGLNIVISILFVKKYGLIGVTVGTLVAAVFRTFQYCIYTSNNVVHRSVFILIKRIVLSALVFFTVFMVHKQIGYSVPKGFIQWVLQSIQMSVVSISTVFIIEFLFYRDTLRFSTKKITNAILKRKKE